MSFPSETIAIVPLPDRVLDAVGHDPRSPYAERFWLPVLGPSTVWLLRRLVTELEAHPEGYEMHLVETARSLGLSSNPARHSPFSSALVRLVQFGAAQYHPNGLAVRRKLPFLAARHLDRLPEALRSEHQAWVDHDDRHTSASMRRRAYSLALTLRRLGESPDEVRWQLTQWRFPLSTCDEALAWAEERCEPTTIAATPTTPEAA